MQVDDKRHADDGMCRSCVRACVRARECVRVSACVRARARACVRMRVCAFGNAVRAGGGGRDALHPNRRMHAAAKYMYTRYTRTRAACAARGELEAEGVTRSWLVDVLLLAETHAMVGQVTHAMVWSAV
jgi:hypothetical protein